MSWSWREVGTVLVAVVLAGATSGVALLAFGALGLSPAYASVVGLSVAMPLLLYATRSSLSIDRRMYAAHRGRDGAAVDAVLVVVVGAVAGCAATYAALQSSLGEPWLQSIGVGVAVLAANAVFIERNRAFFDGNPWVGGKLGEWLGR